LPKDLFSLKTNFTCQGSSSFLSQSPSNPPITTNNYPDSSVMEIEGNAGIKSSSS